MRTLSITLPDDLYARLIHAVPPRKISKFVNEAVVVKLDENLNELYQSYLEANQDVDREAEIEEWHSLNAEPWPMENSLKKEKTKLQN